MQFVSTRKQSAAVSASPAIASGLASDGGLYVPTEWPKFSDYQTLSRLDFPSLAAEVLLPFFQGDPLAKHIPGICKAAFDFPVPVRALSDRIQLLELFHGPTAAFKDFGARFLAACLAQIPHENANIPRQVLVATSGDTGGAVAAAFSSQTQIPVAILYPKGRISNRQEIQLTVWGPRVRAFAVKASFDHCQALVKQAFQDDTWKARFSLISANSINIARLLPQMICFASASLQHFQRSQRPANFAIPSGNVGNATACIWARQIGFPIDQITFAHNANHAVPDYFASGIWKSHPSLSTLANAMDVGSPSNFERVLHLYPPPARPQFLSAISVNDDEIQKTILATYKNFKTAICPHTACAIHACEAKTGSDWIAVATAHAAKFESIVEPLIGNPVKIPPSLSELLGRESTKTEIDPHLKELEHELF